MLQFLQHVPHHHIHKINVSLFQIQIYVKMGCKYNNFYHKLFILYDHRTKSYFQSKYYKICDVIT